MTNLEMENLGMSHDLEMTNLEISKFMTLEMTILKVIMNDSGEDDVQFWRLWWSK